MCTEAHIFHPSINNIALHAMMTRVNTRNELRVTYTESLISVVNSPSPVRMIRDLMAARVLYSKNPDHPPHPPNTLMEEASPSINSNEADLHWKDLVLLSYELATIRTFAYMRTTYIRILTLHVGGGGMIRKLTHIF